MLSFYSWAGRPMARAGCGARAWAWGLIDQTNAPGREGVATLRRVSGDVVDSARCCGCDVSCDGDGDGGRMADMALARLVCTHAGRNARWLEDCRHWPAGQVCAQASSWSSLNAGEAVGRFSFCGEERGRAGSKQAGQLEKVVDSRASILRDAPIIMTPEWLFRSIFRLTLPKLDQRLPVANLTSLLPNNNMSPCRVVCVPSVCSRHFHEYEQLHHNSRTSTLAIGIDSKPG